MEKIIRFLYQDEFLIRGKIKNSSHPFRTIYRQPPKTIIHPFVAETKRETSRRKIHQCLYEYFFPVRSG